MPEPRGIGAGNHSRRQPFVTGTRKPLTTGDTEDHREYRQDWVRWGEVGEGSNLCRKPGKKCPVRRWVAACGVVGWDRANLLFPSESMLILLQADGTAWM